MRRKSIMLTGDASEQLHPATLAMSKPLPSVFDKAMTYYPRLLVDKVF